MDPSAHDVLMFWFGALDGNEPREAWFKKDAAFDASIQQRFGALIASAVAGGLAHWAADAHSALARIVVLDQFTRNTGRDTPRAFAGDALALVAAREMVAKGQDMQLTPVQRKFAYLPYEHSEDISAQREGLKHFAVLAWQHPSAAAAFEWALKHYDIVVRFGRYPHRNAALGRASTAAELEFLAQPGSSF
jgi:uncharacterized protein (DUF924 family)